MSRESGEVKKPELSAERTPFFWRSLVPVRGLQKLLGRQAANALRLFVNGGQQFLQGCFHLRAERSGAGWSFGDFGAEFADPVVEAALWHTVGKAGLDG